MTNPVDRISRRLKIRDLHLLQAVVQWKSMAKAASHLHLTQPAVSKAISELEHAVGVRLLDYASLSAVPLRAVDSAPVLSLGADPEFELVASAGFLTGGGILVGDVMAARLELFTAAGSPARRIGRRTQLVRSADVGPDDGGIFHGLTVLPRRGPAG